jgi:hypothetical protein
LISFSIPILSSKVPIITAKEKVKPVYIRVAFRPKKVRNRAIIAGFKIGDDIKKDIAPLKGASLLNNPTRIGMVEQEQKGVNAPKAAPIILLTPLLGVESIRLILSLDKYF